MAVLAELTGYYRAGARYPADRYDPYFILNLQELQGVLSIGRGATGESKYRIALKAFPAAARRDPNSDRWSLWQQLRPHVKPSTAATG